MKIALDYDKTYDADPELWDDFIRLCNVMGHEVVVLTFRDDRFDVTPLLVKLADIVPVYFTRGVAKRWWSEQFGPGKIDVWIDDKPEAIIHNSDFGTDQLLHWRKEVGGIVGDTRVAPWKPTKVEAKDEQYAS